MTTTRERLRRLPELAAEAFLTWDAPNPAPEAERTGKRRNPHPPAPTRLDVLDALRTSDDGHLAMLTECVRIVWEQLRWDSDRDQWPDPREHQPTWTGECGWLLATFDWWQANLDAADLGWVEGTITDAATELERVVREPRPARLRCPTCEDVLRVQDGGMVTLCDSGHEHPGPMRLAALWARKPPSPAAIIEMELGVKQATLRKWHQRRKIKPAYRDGRVDYWLPWDVVRVLYPGIEDTLTVGA